ncbi:MAG: hypothetical protein ACTHK6_10635 [Solirubrobacterales bacterium]
MNEDPSELTAFLAELQHAADLLVEGGIAQERMALAIVDSLAERLLYQHAQRCFSVGDTGAGILTDPFPADRRAKILGDFRKRVQLALVDEEFYVFVSPLLDDLDAEIFRLAHDYRGPSYHRGEHNPALAGPLGRLYVQAVGRALTRAMGDSFWSFPPGSVKELERYGVLGTGAFSPRSDTGPVVESLTGQMTVDRNELARRLCADAEKRLKAVEDVIESLRRDLDEEMIGNLIEGAQHWAEHRGDKELHQLAREEQGLKNEAEDQEELDEELKQRIIENKLAQIARMEELKDETEIRVDLGTINSLRQRVGQFAGKETIASLLHAYRQVDDLLEVLETAAEWVQYSWDRSVEQAVDEALGK